MIRPFGECGAVGFRISDEHAAAIVRNRHPVMKIEGQRIRATDPGGLAIPRSPGNLSPGAKCAVHMKPQLFGRGDVGEGIEVVEGSGVDRASRTHDGEWLQAGAPVSGDLLGREVQAMENVSSTDPAQVVAADAEQFEGLPDGAVRLGGRVAYQLRPRGRARLPDIGSGPRAARKRNDRGHRSAGREYTAGRMREPRSRGTCRST